MGYYSWTSQYPVSVTETKLTKNDTHSAELVFQMSEITMEPEDVLRLDIDQAHHSMQVCGIPSALGSPGDLSVR